MKNDKKSSAREAEAGGRRQMGIDVTRTGEGFHHPGSEPKKAERPQNQIGDFTIDLVACADRQSCEESQRQHGARRRVVIGKW